MCYSNRQAAYILVMHLDGKFLPDILLIEEVDHLHALVSGEGRDELF